MLKLSVYGQLFDAFRLRGVLLINDVAAYTHGHYLPDRIRRSKEERQGRYGCVVAQR